MYSNWLWVIKLIKKKRWWWSVGDATVIFQGAVMGMVRVCDAMQ